MDQLWINKYKPTTIDEIVGNKNQLLLANEWLNDFKNGTENTVNVLYITGTPGTGKTLLATLLFSKYKYDMIEFNASHIRSQRSIQTELNKCLDSTNISVMKSDKKKCLGVLMDEIDGFGTGDRGGIAEIISIIRKNKIRNTKHPIICVNNNLKDKKMQDLKKLCFQIRLDKLLTKDLLNISKKIITQEKIKITKNALEMLINHSQGDCRKMITLLQDICNTFINVKIDKDRIIKFFEHTTIKKVDMGLYDVASKLLFKQNCLDEIISLYDSDTSLVSMMIHENIASSIHNSTIDDDDKIKKLYNCICYIALGDIIDKQIYNKQLWNLQYYAGFIKCGMPISILSEFKRKKFNVEFTSILSKSSLQYANHKNIIYFKNKTGVNYRYIVDLTNVYYPLLIDKDKRKSICDYFTSLSNDISDIDKYSKINRLNHQMIDSKKEFTLKKKREIKNYFKPYYTKVSTKIKK